MKQHFHLLFLLWVNKQNGRSLGTVCACMKEISDRSIYLWNKWKYQDNEKADHALTYGHVYWAKKIVYVFS